MSRLAYGNPATSRYASVCERCYQPLYSGQPMAVDACAARELRGCAHICRPDDDCPISTGSPLHVGCAVLRRNGEL